MEVEVPAARLGDQGEGAKSLKMEDSSCEQGKKSRLVTSAATWQTT